MKNSVKPLIFGATLSALGLCCTISHAAPKVIASETEQMPLFAMNHALSETSFQELNIDYLTKNDAFEQLMGMPLARISLSNKSIETTDSLTKNITHKKNEFFEMTTQFNDKLQQIIASIEKSFRGEKSSKSIANSTEITKASTYTKNCNAKRS